MEFYNLGGTLIRVNGADIPSNLSEWDGKKWIPFKNWIRVFESGVGINSNTAAMLLWDSLATSGIECTLIQAESFLYEPERG